MSVFVRFGSGFFSLLLLVPLVFSQPFIEVGNSTVDGNLSVGKGGSLLAVCLVDGTDCPAGVTDTIWEINTTVLRNETSGLLGVVVSFWDNLYASRIDWTTHDDYPSACASGDFVTQIGDSLTCLTPSYIVDTNSSTFTNNLHSTDCNLGSNEFMVGTDDSGNPVCQSILLPPQLSETQVEAMIYDEEQTSLFSLWTVGGAGRALFNMTGGLNVTTSSHVNLTHVLNTPTRTNNVVYSNGVERTKWVNVDFESVVCIGGDASRATAYIGSVSPPTTQVGHVGINNYDGACIVLGALFNQSTNLNFVVPKGFSYTVNISTAGFGFGRVLNWNEIDL